MTIYDVFFFLFSLAYLPYLVVKGKAHRDFAERFGKLPSAFAGIGASKPVWIHAVSVGEVMAVKDFVEKIHEKFPGRKIVLSTTTTTGNEVARRIFTEDILKFYFPLDFSFVLRRVINLLNPCVLVIMETEIWPNLILELSRRKVPVLIINGRISDHSFKGYRKIRFFFAKILKRINLCCMQTSEDAGRIEALGAPKEAVKVTGNMKFDIEEPQRPPRFDRAGSTGAVEKVLETSKLLMAGSTHGGEEEIILDVYGRLAREFQRLRLLIAPRHIDRAEAIKKLVERKGFEAVLLSEFRKKGHKPIPEKAVLILDTFGELNRVYNLATIVFMGGSLVRRGGHNIIEPATFAKPIVFGAHMFNFRDIARSFLENDAAIKVKNKEALLKTLETLLKDENRRNRLGRNAKELIDKSKGATLRNIGEIEQILLKRNGGNAR